MFKKFFGFVSKSNRELELPSVIKKLVIFEDTAQEMYQVIKKWANESKSDRELVSIAKKEYAELKQQVNKMKEMEMPMEQKRSNAQLVYAEREKERKTKAADAVLASIKKR